MMLYTPQDRIITLGVGMQVHARAIGDALVYLFKDTFPVNESAPMTTPRTCEVGVADVASAYYSIISGELEAYGDSTVYRYYNDSTSRAAAAGRAVFTKNRFTRTGTGDNATHGWINRAGGRDAFGFTSLFNRYALQVYGSDLSVGLPTANASYTYKTAIIRRAPGAFYCLHDGSAWKLLWVDKSMSGSLYAGIASYRTIKHYFDYMAVMDMSAPWNALNDVATGYTASPSSGATLTHEAECMGEITWVANTGQTLELDLRYTNSSNRLCVRCSQGGSTIKVIEIVGGTETERASASQTWTNGTTYRVVAMLHGTEILTFVDVFSSYGSVTAKNTYSSVTASLTGTSARVTVGGGAMSDFTTWPRTLSGAALAELQRWDVL